MTSLAGLGVEKAYEIGPGKVLMGLLRRIDRGIKCTPTESPDSIATLKNLILIKRIIAAFLVSTLGLEFLFRVVVEPQSESNY